jgi:hypothetical protein
VVGATLDAVEVDGAEKEIREALEISSVFKRINYNWADQI